MQNLFKTALIAAFLSLSAHAGAENFPIHYNGFDVVLDCQEKLPIYAGHHIGKDMGNFPRRDSFSLDKDVPKSCQQTSADSYKMPYKINHQTNRKISFDRGHLVAANQLDNNEESIYQSNYMTNIVPMTSTVNRKGGAWYATESLTECTRDNKDFTVHMGIIIGTDASNDYFVRSHGVKTPDYLWKVLYDGANVISWIIPNTDSAFDDNLDGYRVSVSEIEKRAGITLPLPAHIKPLAKQSEWPMPEYCDFR